MLLEPKMGHRAIIDPLLIASIAWLLTVFGWFLSNHQANKREQRKELRALIKKTEETLETICRHVELHLFDFSTSHNPLDFQKNTIAITNSFNRLEVDLLPIYKYVSCKECIRKVSTSKEKLFDFTTGDLLDPHTPLFKESVKIQSLIHVKALCTSMLKSLEEAFTMTY